jgi:hypothetical protein
MDKTCSATECDRAPKARGYCNTHYEQARTGRHVGPIRRRRPVGMSDNNWFDTQVALDGSGCLVWIAGKITSGYGQFYPDAGRIPAHRFAYERSYGKIPDDMIIDHQCGNRACVTPEHLKAVTIKGNNENRAVRHDSATGLRGVQPSGKKSHPWVASLTHNRKRIHVGYFDNIKDAHAAVVAARARYFTNSVSDVVGR